MAVLEFNYLTGDNAFMQEPLKQHSLALEEIIRETIGKEDSISFSQFMQMALYQPGFGYYSSGTHKFGEQGDFVTSPELGDLFAKCVAKQFQQILDQIETPIVLELGAGTGQFCFDCLLELDRMNCLPEKYCILEVSADLQQRQQTYIKQLLPELFHRVTWLSALPNESLNAIVIANEVFT